MKRALAVVACAALGCGATPASPRLDATVAGSDASMLPDGVGVGLPPGFFPAQRPAFAAAADEPGTVQVSISGESLAEHGYPYTSTPRSGAAVFVDGWELRFDRYLVVVDHVRLNRASPDPSMRASLGGLVACADGPWIVDLHRHGSLTGAGGPPESATPVAVLRATVGGDTLDPSVRYAFSFDVAPAGPTVRNVNLGIDAADDAARMIASGWTTYFSGLATYRGRPASSESDPAFADYPTVVRFGFGFAAPASYLNCHNPELGDADTAANRGVQPSAAGHVRAQITMHTDHFFWDEADVEGTPLHFDPIAARAHPAGVDAGAASPAVVTLADLAGDLPASLTDSVGRGVRDRGGQTQGVVDDSPPPSYAVRGAGAMVHDLRDFVRYNARGGGHLNSDGLCAVQANGPLGD